MAKRKRTLYRKSEMRARNSASSSSSTTPSRRIFNGKFSNNPNASLNFHSKPNRNTTKVTPIFIYQVLPTDGKHDQEIEGFQRGYECLRSQNFEKRTKGDLKEGYYLGKNLLSNDPYVIERRFGQAPNKYPAEVPDPQLFARVMEDYHSVMSTFAKNLLHVLSCTLDLKADFFDDFCDHPVAVLRLLHYPPQDPTTVENERGEFPNKVTDYFP